MTRAVLIGPWAWGDVMRINATSGNLRLISLLNALGLLFLAIVSTVDSKAVDNLFLFTCGFALCQSGF